MGSSSEVWRPKHMVIFDFDKTLTYQDTTLAFFRYCGTQRGTDTPGNRLGWYLRALGVKAGRLTNDSIKEYGINTYLAGATEREITHWGRAFAPLIKTNHLLQTEFTKYPSAWVVSASLKDYVEPRFPNHKVLASVLRYRSDGTVTGYRRNLYGERKVAALRNAGVKRIDLLYTDSYSDRPLMDIAQKTILVRGDKMTELRG